MSPAQRVRADSYTAASIGHAASALTHRRSRQMTDIVVVATPGRLVLASDHPQRLGCVPAYPLGSAICTSPVGPADLSILSGYEVFLRRQVQVLQVV